MNRVRNIIGEKRFKKSTNQNTNIGLELEVKTKPLTEYDIIDIVNLQNIFDSERNKSKIYRFNGKLNIYTSNILSPKAISSDWDPLFKGNPPVMPNNWVMQIVYPSTMDVDYTIVNNNPTTPMATKAYRGLQYTSLSSTTVNNSEKLTLHGVQKHNLEVGEYVYVINDTYQGFHRVQSLGVDGDNTTTSLTLDTIIINPIVNNLTNNNNFVRVVNVSKDDVSFNNPSLLTYSEPTNISGNTGVGYTTVTTSTNHGLSVNDFVDIRISPLNEINGVWKIINTPTPNTFVIKVDSNIHTYSSAYFRRVDGTPSEYYIRYFEVITSNDYEVYKCAFSSNVYSDVSDVTIGTANDSWMLQFNKDIDITTLRDNRGGEISQLYYTIIKRAGKNTYQWSNVTSDWDFNSKYTNTWNGIENISIVNPNGIGSVEKKTPRINSLDQNGDLLTHSGDKYVGEFVEFNRYDIIERPVAEVINRFANNTNSDGEGYYYKPFKLLQIRKFSTEIETADTYDSVVDVPSNYVEYPDGSIAWRDMLTIGYLENGDNGVDYPFNNGAHYIYFNHNLYVRRQIPVNLIDGGDINIVTDINEEC